MSHVSDPWGADQPSALAGPPPPLPPRLARLAQVQESGTPLRDVDPYAEDFPSADELPEVRELMRAGWVPLGSAPLHCLLPAAWPAELRTWVPDRLPRVTLGGTSDRYFGTAGPLPEDEDYDPHADVAGCAEDVGLPEPPRDRIWLLRSPWPALPMMVLHEAIWSQVPDSGGRDQVADYYRAGRTVVTWSEEQVTEACEPDTQVLLADWAAEGRTGELVARFIDLRISPAQLHSAVARTGLDETDLLSWSTAFDELDDAAADFISSWIAAGLPAQPPHEPRRYVDRDPIELRTWLDAGFDLYAAERLAYAGLDTAIHWRKAGFSNADTYELLRADPDLTVEEARAFDTSGAARERKADWVYYGFNASDAAAWAAAALSPSNARLWRAAGQSPNDVVVGDGPPIPPRLIEGLQSFAIGATEEGDITGGPWGDIPDPPGTRGRGARRAHGDTHPWINTD